MRPIRSRLTVSLLTLTTLAAALNTAAGSSQQAVASPYRSSSGLALRGGATLAPPRILDLRSDPVALSRVVEDQDGSQRRKDTNAEVTYTLQAEVLFAKDSARLSSQAQSRIAAIARQIRRPLPLKVRVFGFTDDLGSSAHGDILSAQRAQAVQDVLAGELPSKVCFETRGFGERNPVASNSTDAGRRANRRVEISFPQADS
ncbi:OmpA family protein [Streptomyces sp. MBT53]|uniref:OmpA family protein n=1 Tax=Streptomyces sp. MBT53 TaxID=1488384 RepID=UPI001913CE2D|nr:OmpA family protein [Streptomyces sp. MBT53]MBK6013532.1 OmpA family protein [Streptomyces sp. MBT53]